MRFTPVVLAAAALLITATPTRGVADASSDTLSFEVAAPDGGLAGWYASTRGTAFQDSATVHGGRFAARIERSPSSPSDFSAISRRFPINFAGDSLEVRGWIKTDGVVGYAGLWLREDGDAQTFRYDNMKDRALAGTTPWTEYRIVLPLEKRATIAVFGALLAGQGTTYVDDLRVLVDGRPVSEAAPLVREPTAVERDHEFDQGSRVEAATLTAAQVENLAILGKVWGFLKYHHPRATSAKLHWDYELFRVLPEVLRARDRAAGTRAIARWMARAGEPDPCAPCATAPDSAYLLPPIDWIRDRALLGADLSKRLERVHRNRDADDDQFYITMSGIKPDFSNEASYARLVIPDFGYRLLALFRFWNIIEYWFPYRDVMGEDWEAVLREFIPRLVRVSDREAYRREMVLLVARVHDGHANAWNAIDARPPVGECRLPVIAWPVGSRFVVGKYMDRERGRASGLEIGDVILEVDGRSVDSLVATWAPYYGASNESAQRREIGRALTKGPCGSSGITVDRQGKRLELFADRDSLGDLGRAHISRDRPGETFQLLTKDVAYLKLSSIEARKIPEYVERAAGARCLVIDIRNYPGEYVPYLLGQHLVDQPTPFVRFTYGDLTNPGAILWTAPFSLQPAEPRYDGQVVILVNETSQSQAEFTAMALRAVPGAIVVGSTTAGADGELVRFPLPGALRAAISGLGVFYPDKRPTQRIGVVPDLTVHPTVEGIRAGRDEVLEAALKKVFGTEVPISGP